MSKQEISVELQFELKKLEFTPYGKQRTVYAKLIDELDVFSPDFKQQIAQLEKENDLFF